MDIYRSQINHQIRSEIVACPAGLIGRESSGKGLAINPLGKGIRPASPWQCSDRLLTQAALSAAKNQRYDRALTMLDELVARQPQSAEYHNNRGLVYFWSGQYEAALADYSRAIQLNPELDRGYNNRGNCYAALGRWPEALADYEVAIDLNPFNVRARVNFGITLRDLGQYAEAVETLDEALLFHQMMPHIYAERGRSYQLWGDWNCALADYSRALAAMGDLPTSQQDEGLHQRITVWQAELTPTA